MRYWLKTCPRCHGDLRQESDVYGKYIACVQCGYILRAEEEELLVATGLLEPELIRELAA
jgi:hypothetical protein